MENKNIIIVLIVIIVILAVMIGITVLHPFDSKEPSKVKITSNRTLTEGDNLTLQLTDLNKTALSKQKVNVTVKDSKGKVVLNKTVKTNSKGKAKLDLDLKKGKYAVNEAQLTSSSSESSSSDPGAYYSRQSLRTYYTGDIVQEPGGGYMRHLGNNRWEPV